jgi:aromatic ring-opening dioxygenase catalytic subunit (LigB family)
VPFLIGNDLNEQCGLTFFFFLPRLGPMPILGDPAHRDMIASMKNRVPKILKLGTAEAPRAIVVVTAHWQTEQPTISSGRSHSLYYDYYGFPPEAYSLKYPAPGSPEVAAEAKAALDSQGFKSVLDDKRGKKPIASEAYPGGIG